MLRTATPNGVRAPQDVICPGHLDHLSEHVHAHFRGVLRGHIKGATQLKVEVLDLRVALEDAEKVADPGDFLWVAGFRVLHLLAATYAEQPDAAEPRVVNDEVQI